MQSDFARDLADQDRPIEEAAAERPGKALKLRIQPMILHGRQYRAWRDVRWTLEVDSPAEAFAARDAMRAFFEALVTHGPEVVARTLGAIPTAGKAASAA